MRIIKFQVDDKLWERFFRAFPGHGERSTLLRKIVRNIILSLPEFKPLETIISEKVIADLTKEDFDE